MDMRRFTERLENEICWQYGRGGYDPAKNEGMRAAFAEKLQTYAGLFAETAFEPNATAADFENLAYSMMSLAAMACQAWDFAIRRGTGPLRDPERRTGED